MSDTVFIPGIMRPLALSALDDLFSDSQKSSADRALGLLADVLGDGTDPIATAKRRYQEVTDERREPIIVPDHDSIMRHVIRPLREAKRCYVLGMPVACIAQAGLVGEMVALWRFRMLDLSINGNPFDTERQKLLLGREFDKLGQEPRIKVLKGFGSLDEDTERAFKELKDTRAKYLHFMIEESRDVDADARKALECANSLVLKTLDMKFDEGRIVLPPHVLKYIKDIPKVSGTDDATTVVGAGLHCSPT